MPESGSSPSRRATPVAALDALLADAAGDPLRRALWLDALDRRLRPLLPPSLAAHAQLANVDGGKLVYLVDAPIWHARLRLASSQLLDAARSVGLKVDRLVVRIAPPAVPAPVRKAAPAPSAKAQEALRDAIAIIAAATRSKPD